MIFCKSPLTAVHYFFETIRCRLTIYICSKSIEIIKTHKKYLANKESYNREEVSGMGAMDENWNWSAFLRNFYLKFWKLKSFTF